MRTEPTATRLAPRNPTSLQIFPWIVLGVCAAVLSVALGVMAYASTLRVSHNYNEGWNAYLAHAAMSGGPLYFPNVAWFTNNYPPLSFYLVGGIGKLFGDAILAGRAVAWVGYLSITGLIVAILRRLGNDPLAAWFGGLLFAGYMAAQYHAYIGLNDPQLFALAVSCLGLFILLRFERAVWASVAAALFITLALFIKHSIAALPIAVAIWLLRSDRRTALGFIVTGLVGAVFGLALCRMIFGPDFIAGLLAPRLYSFERGYRSFLDLMQPMQIPLVAGAAALLAATRDRFSVLFGLYAFVALVVGFVGGIGEGTSYNRFFELLIAVALASGHLVGRLRAFGITAAETLRAATIGACALAIALGAGLEATKDTLLIKPWIAEQRAEEAGTLSGVRQIAARPGPALCESLAFCYWARKPMEVDLFNAWEAVLTGRKNADPLKQRIASGYYGSAEFNSSERAASPPFLEELRAAFATRYAMVALPHKVGDLYLPRD